MSDTEPDPRPEPRYGQYAPPGYEPPQGAPRNPAPSPYGPPSGAPSGPPPYAPPPAWDRPAFRPGGSRTIGDAVAFAFGAFGRSWGVWLGAALLVGVVSLAEVGLTTPGLFEAFSPENLERAAAGEAPALSEPGTTATVLGLLLSVVVNVLTLFLMKGALVATRQERVAFRDLFGVRWSVIGLYVLLGVLTGLAALLPGPGVVVWFALTVVLTWVPFALLAEDTGGLEAVRRGVRVFTSHAGLSLLTLVVAFVLLAVGALFCGVGMLVAFPVVLLLQAHLYRGLTQEDPAGA